MSAAIRILAPATADDWHHVDSLLAQLQEWDLKESQLLGLEAAEVQDLFYSGGTRDVRGDCAPPQGGFLLAMSAGSPAGCAGFYRLEPGVCELTSVFVRPDCRGLNIGSLLVTRLIGAAQGVGYHTMRLETAAFMRSAHRLYESRGFKRRSPYREVPSKIKAVTFWMERPL